MSNIITLIGLKNLIIYFLIINLIGFLSMGIDKLKAKKDWWRIPEGTLLMIAILGGGIGSILGMYTFRHKTKKMKFTVGMPTILISEIALIFYCFIKFP